MYGNKVKRGTRGFKYAKLFTSGSLCGCFELLLRICHLLLPCRPCSRILGPKGVAIMTTYVICCRLGTESQQCELGQDVTNGVNIAVRQTILTECLRTCLTSKEHATGLRGVSIALCAVVLTTWNQCESLQLRWRDIVTLGVEHSRTLTAHDHFTPVSTINAPIL